MDEWKIAAEELPKIGELVEVKVISLASGKRTGESSFVIEDNTTMSSTVIAWKPKDVKNENSELQRPE